MKEKNKKKAYVVGNNTSNSLSPDIFQYWFKKYNINAEYNFAEINEKNFDKEIKLILKEKDLVGINITIPYKEKITPHLSLIEPTNLINLKLKVRLPTNCITIKKNKIVGHNTDIIGFQNAYTNKTKNNKKNKNQATVFGCGGAAKAIIYSLAELGFKEIMVFNRTFEKANEAKKDFLKKTKLPTSVFKTYRTQDIKQKITNTDIAINTTPTNVFEKTPGIKTKNNCIGFDVVYKPK